MVVNINRTLELVSGYQIKGILSEYLKLIVATSVNLMLGF